MADGFLFNAIEKLIGKLGSMTVQAWNVRDDVEKLVESMSEIKAAILDAEEQQGATNNSNEVQRLLLKLKNALDDVEDLLDDFNIEVLSRQVMTKDMKAKQVRIFFSPSNQMVFSFKMAQKIKDLKKSIDGLNLNSTNRTPREQLAMKQRETHSFIREEEVIGRKEEKEKLMQFLLNTDIDEKENVSVISIVGFGGLGKTALAQLVYNDEVVQAHFELTKWVCVADEDSNEKGFDVKGVATKIVDSKTNDAMDEVQQKLRKMVGGKRYLLVLDDVWKEDHEQWLHLMTMLKDGAKGSKIIVTTRSKKVAKASSPLDLKGLDAEQSWRLFCQFAFQNGEEPENQNLVKDGKEIVTKCSGVPLAIKSIGSLMFFMETEKEWSSFKNKDLLKIDEQEGDNKIFQLIKLSYDHLPFHLRRCFAFCSLLPKDYCIKREMLVRLWVAQGFVELADESDESTCLEDIGDKYLTTLVHRSFFQDVTRDDFGDILYFKMHDLMHDLARRISGNYYVPLNEKMQQHIDKGTRHVSFGFLLDSSWQAPSSLLEVCKLRTLLLPQHDYRWYWHQEISLEESACDSIMSCSKQFRVLNLNYLNSRKVPSCIGMLKHLRYLDLSFSKELEVLPMSITKLINLETLILNGCSKLRELPRDIWKLINLRHLELRGCYALSFMPHGIGQLTNLQTLTQFVLDTTSKQNQSAGASELGKLNNLRGGLELEGLECLRRSPIEAAKDMNLIGKPHLHTLTLDWGEQSDYNVEMEKDDIILQGLHLHPNIKVLRIRRFGGMTFSSSVNAFTYLSKLSLISCTRLQYLLQLQLHVKSIELINLPCLEWIVNGDNNNNGSSSTFHPSLKEINLFELPNLNGWCRCNEEELQRGCCHQFNSLDFLYIFNCPNLISIPQHTNIKKIALENVREEVLRQAVNHSNVERLDMNRICGLKSLSGVIQHLTTLGELRIKNYEELDLCNDDEDGCYSMEWKQLKSLRYLEFYNIPKMQSLPEGLQHVTTLRILRIRNCENLTSIPEWVTSLQVLDISHCPKLTSVPTGVHVY